MATLGEVIRTRRAELGLTQDQLADRIGIGVRQSEISRLEHDRISLPRRERMEQLARALDLPLGVLLASSGWVGADVTFAPEPESLATEAPTDPLSEVLEEAKEVVHHLQDLVDAAEAADADDAATLPGDDGPRLPAG